MFSFIISIVVNIGMWFERFVIIVTSLHRDYLPSSWTMFSPTFIDIGILCTVNTIFSIYSGQDCINEEGVIYIGDICIGPPVWYAVFIRCDCSVGEVVPEFVKMILNYLPSPTSNGRYIYYNNICYTFYEWTVDNVYETIDLGYNDLTEVPYQYYDPELYATLCTYISSGDDETINVKCCGSCNVYIRRYNQGDNIYIYNPDDNSSITPNIPEGSDWYFTVSTNKLWANNFNNLLEYNLTSPTTISALISTRSFASGFLTNKTLLSIFAISDNLLLGVAYDYAIPGSYTSKIYEFDTTSSPISATILQNVPNFTIKDIKKTTTNKYIILKENDSTFACTIEQYDNSWILEYSQILPDLQWQTFYIYNNGIYLIKYNSNNLYQLTYSNGSFITTYVSPVDSISEPFLTSNQQFKCINIDMSYLVPVAVALRIWSYTDQYEGCSCARRASPLADACKSDNNGDGLNMIPVTIYMELGKTPCMVGEYMYTDSSLMTFYVPVTGNLSYRITKGTGANCVSTVGDFGTIGSDCYEYDSSSGGIQYICGGLPYNISPGEDFGDTC
jgi:hypothetical protein